MPRLSPIQGAGLSPWRRERRFGDPSSPKSVRDLSKKAEMTSQWLKKVQAQPRLITSVVLGCLLWFVLPGQPSTRALLAWDCSTSLYFVLALTMMARSNIDQIRNRSAMQDEGQLVILALTTITALVSLAGVMVELSIAKTLQGHSRLETCLARGDHRPPVLELPAHHVRGALRA